MNPLTVKSKVFTELKQPTAYIEQSNIVYKIPYKDYKKNLHSS